MEHGFMLKEKKTCRKIGEKENLVIFKFNVF